MVKRFIVNITFRSIIMLFHANRFWPEVITHVLWPFVFSWAINLEITLAIYALGRTPIQKLTATEAPIILRDHRSWGYPVQVLEHKVQDSSKGLPKWKPRSRTGSHLGRSPDHTGNVALFLNHFSSNVSPPFNVVFDNEFSLMPALSMNAVPSK